MASKIIYLKKANDDLVSNCKCNDGRITYPPQQDCPWCGCGWLFTCISSRKAFTFAAGIELETNWEELATADWKGWGMQRVSKKNIASCVGYAIQLVILAPQPATPPVRARALSA